MRSIISSIGIAFLLITSACGSKSGSEAAIATAADSIAADTETPILNGNPRQLSQLIDSLALNADDLSPRRAVEVLQGYVQVIDGATSHRSRLENMRKFVDVYDIVASNHGKDFTRAIERHASSSEIDLQAKSAEYRQNLRDYSDGSGMEVMVQQRDTTSTTTSSAEAPTEAADK